MTNLFLSNNSYQLRPYQQEALDSIPESGAYVICLATGLGKSLTFSQVPRRGRMLILSHRDELVHQPAKYFDCSFGVEQAGETSHGEEIVSASVQSLVRRLEKFRPDDFDVLVTDECFPAGTQVDGVPIEKIKVGDFVNAFNHETGKIEKREVLHVFKRPAPEKMAKINNSLVCTLNHPIFEVKAGEYVNARDLKLGDELLHKQRKKRRTIIARVEKFKIFSCKNFKADGYVYNLEVEGLNNYFANGYLVHNCHHATAPTYRKIYDHFKPRLHLGFTATPNRDDGVGLKEIFQDIIFERNLRWGIENGYLSDINCLRVEIGYDLRKVATRLGDYAAGELDKAVNIAGANKAIAQAYEKYAKPPCLIFCTSVDHAQKLAELIPGAVAVKGGEDRTETVRLFSEGKIPCITNCMVFTEGTDLPNVQSIIIARPTKNISLYTQMVGRGLRLYPGKKYMTLLDCVGAGDSIDICTAPSLLGLDINDVPPKQRQQIKGHLFQLPEIIEQCSDTPESWIKNVQVMQLWAKKNKYDTHGVNFFKMPDGSLIVQDITLPPIDSLGRIMWEGKPEPAQKVFDVVHQLLQTQYSDQRSLWDLNLTKRWASEGASEKQIAIIRRKFPSFDTSSLTKFQAAQILTRCFAPEPPTQKQIYFLKRRGYDVKNLSKREASKLIGRLA